MRELSDLFAALQESTFRARFQLSQEERAYLADRSFDTVLLHARQFIVQRLADRAPVNDGRQTPMRGHPVFVAQHATATCCRKCLATWHGIEVDRPLTSDEIEHIVRVIGHWLAQQPRECARKIERQQWLFPKA